MLVTVYAVDDSRCSRPRPDEPGGPRAEGPSTLVHLQRAEALPGGRDHFGFFDGIAQPAVRGSGVAPGRATASPTAPAAGASSRPASCCSATSTRTARRPRRRWRRCTATPPTSSTGSCTWTRRRSGAPCAGAGYPGGADALAAKIVGRWADGTPLARLARRSGRRGLWQPDADQRLRLRRRSARPEVPGRRARPPLQPARRSRLLRRAACPIATGSCAAAALTDHRFRPA